jgi:hypothetical protein
MKMTAMVGIVGTGLLAACGAPGGTAGGAGRAGVATAPADLAVTFEGVAYDARLRPGPAGQMLTGQGAVPVQGRTIEVRRAGGDLGYDEGRAAKAVAVEACALARGRVNPGAIGRFEAGAWLFEGACA